MGRGLAPLRIGTEGWGTKVRVNLMDRRDVGNIMGETNCEGKQGRVGIHYNSA